MPAPAGLIDRLVEAARPLGSLAVSASVGDEVLVEHPSPVGASDPPPLWNVWCAVKPPVACAVLALLERAGIASTRPLHEYVPVPGMAADPTLTVAAILRHESRLPALDPIEIEMLPPADRPARLHACLTGDARRPTAVAAYSQYLGWWLLLAAVEAVHGGDAEALVQAELREAGHPDLLVWVPVASHAAVERRLGLYTSGDDRFERPLVHDRARAVVVHAGAAIRGYASPASLRSWYHDLAATLSGRRRDPRPAFPGRAVLAELLTTPRDGEDATLHRRCSFAGGFMVDLPSHHFGTSLSARALGHSGWRGLSAGFLDPDTGLTAGIVHQRTGSSGTVAAVRTKIVELLARGAA